MNERTKSSIEFWAMVLAVMLLLITIATPVRAADISGLDAIAVDNGTENTNGTITGSYTSSKSNTNRGFITMTLTGDGATLGDAVGALSFDVSYTLNGASKVSGTQGSADISASVGMSSDSVTKGSKTGTASITIENWKAGSTWTVTMGASSAKGSLISGYSTSSSSVTISNIVFTEYKSDSVTFVGTDRAYIVGYYADATTTTMSTVTVAANAEGVQVSAALARGVSITSDGGYVCDTAQIVRGDATISLVAEGSVIYPEISDIITPVLAHDWDGDGIAAFLVNGKRYWNWDAALTAAGNSGTIILNEDYTHSENWVIPQGVTFLIPYSDSYVCRGAPNDWTLEDFDLFREGFPDTPEVNIVSAKVYKDTPNVEYRRLTMAEGAHITVNGSLEVSGQTHPLASGQWGNYAVLQMGSNTSITIGSTGTLYAYGYIRGNGTVTVASGGVVYEHYDVADYPPGGAGGLDPMNTAGVFGMTNYSFNNIEVPTTYNAGAELRAYLVMTGYNIGTNAFTRTFIGSDSDAIFHLKNRTITKTYSGGRQSFVIAGDVEFNRLYININAAVVNYTVDSSQTSGLPISHNWDITVTNNSTVTLNGSVLVYAGSTITVDSGSKIVIPSGIKLSLLDSESDPSAVTTNAVLDVNGEIQVDGGFYNSYTNTSIPIIKSSGGTGKVIVNNVGDETTFNVRASGDNYESVNITPAKLLNDDKTKYVETANETGTYTYYASTGRWDKPSHFYDETAPVVTAPTCVDTGYTTHACAVCGHSYTDSETPATGNHSYREGVQTTAPTCTTPGVMTYTCGVCSDSYTGDIIAAKIGDTEYKILSEAINAATASEIIFLQADIDGEVPVGKLLTINKNGCTADLKAENGFVITETGDDTVTSLIKIMATNVKAGDGLDLYFYILKSAWDSAFPSSQGQAAITREYADGKAPHTPESVAWLTDVEGYYRFRYSDIAAKEMTDPVSIVIRVGDITVSNTYTETIREYALRTFGTGTDELDTALMDMLNYGAAAQSYFGYNTENPANAKDDGGKIEQYAACATRNGTVTPENHLVKGDNLVAVSVSAKSKLMLTFYFENITTDMTAYITYTNHGGSEVTQTVNGSDFIEYNGWLGVDVTGLAIADGRQVVSCEVKNGEDVVASASDSVEGYIFRNYQEGNVVVLDMLMRFVDSAYKYFH